MVSLSIINIVGAVAPSALALAAITEDFLVSALIGAQKWDW
jgi:hypothetical protein